VNPYRLLFEPFRLGRLELPNRIMMAPMGSNLATTKGEVTERLINHYQTRAQGGAGLIVIEGTSVHSSGRGYPRQLSAAADSFLEGLTALALAVRQAGARVLLQLHHGGRNTDPRVSGRPPLGPSSVRGPVGQYTPESMSLDQIELMVEAFGRAAERALEAGFDGVELHGAHEYLIHQFMTPYCNQRTDLYGGDLEGRLRFPLEIIARIRRKLKEALISFRLSGSDSVAGGLTVDETGEMARRLKEAGVDLISVTGGVFETPQLLIPPLDTPHGTHLELASRIREATGGPVAGVGRINSPAMAELALKRGQVDLVACGRAFLTDPRWPLKAKAGEWRTIRRCVGCNQGCIDYFFAGYPITCLYNPRAGHDAELALRPARKKRSVAVVGGGPAGLEAARVLDLMGHRVVLFEQEGRIGGQVNLALRPPGKGEFGQVIAYYTQALARSRVELKLGHRAGPEIIRDLSPDAVVVATGAVPMNDSMKGLPGPNTFSAHQVLAGRAEVGENVVILGGGNVGLETAHLLLSQGRKVTVIEMGRQIGQDLGPARRYLLMRRLRELKLRRMVKCRVRRIHSDRVSFIRTTDNGQRIYQELTGVDTFINALGVRPLDDLALELEELGTIPRERVLLVGDALNPGKILDAVTEGARAALRIEEL